MKLNHIIQIEVTTECNLRCKYCLHPKLAREKKHITMETFERALEWVKFFGKYAPIPELALSGLGESTLHPDFVTIVKRARETIGQEAKLVIPTNGILITEEMVKAVVNYNPRFYVSLHRPERAAHALELLRKYNLLDGYNVSAATSSFDWAGQLDWPVTAPRIECQELAYGLGVVLVDGSIVTCCLDANGKNVLGNISQEMDFLPYRPFDLCKTCHKQIPAKYDQVVLNNLKIDNGGKVSNSDLSDDDDAEVIINPVTEKKGKGAKL